MLLQYAREHHFPNPTFFVDDGVSGVTYDRPGFQAMLAEIEAGRVAVAIAKDLSRLGRNSALTGLYTNFTFPQNGVRFIAINDNYDTIDPMLSLTYETEQKQLETECVTLRQEIEVQERQNENVEKFIQTAHKYVGIDKLDGYALRELVSAIYVDAPDKSSGKRVQHIHIQYDGLGFIPLNELMKEETAWPKSRRTL